MPVIPTRGRQAGPGPRRSCSGEGCRGDEWHELRDVGVLQKPKKRQGNRSSPGDSRRNLAMLTPCF